MIAQQPVRGLLPVTALNSARRREMLDLLQRHFDDVTPAQFERDLAEKNWAIEIRRDGRLVGFSALLARETEFEGEPILAIYSGDTIVSPEASGSAELAQNWI